MARPKIILPVYARVIRATKRIRGLRGSGFVAPRLRSSTHIDVPTKTARPRGPTAREEIAKIDTGSVRKIRKRVMVLP